MCPEIKQGFEQGTFEANREGIDDRNARIRLTFTIESCICTLYASADRIGRNSKDTYGQTDKAITDCR